MIAVIEKTGPRALAVSVPEKQNRRSFARSAPGGAGTVCKLCKRTARPGQGKFFANGQTREKTDFQCHICTAWELAAGTGPRNIRTDIAHYG